MEEEVGIPTILQDGRSPHTQEFKRDLSALNEALTVLASVNPTRLTRSDLGEADNRMWPTYEAEFPRMVQFFARMRTADFDDMPHEQLRQVLETVRNLAAQANRVLTIRPEELQRSPKAVENEVTELYARWVNAYVELSPKVGYALVRDSDFRALEGRAEQLLQKADDALKRATDVGERLSDLAKSAGVSVNAVHFKAEADRHHRASWFWGFIVLVFAGLTGAYALWYLERPLDGVGSLATAPEILARSVPRIVVLSVLSFALIWAARNFSASRHNVIVNRHRQNALSTFQLFLENATDPNARNAAMLYATQSVFAPQPSGYARAEGEAPQSNQVIEFVQRLTGKEGS